MAARSKHLKSVHGHGEGGGWDTDDGYSPKNFYTNSLDDKGHSAWTTNIRIPTYVKAKIHELIQSGEFPHLRTEQDLIRDAIVHRLHALAELSDTPEIRELLREEVARAMVISKIHHERVRMADYKQLLADLENFVQEAASEPSEYVKARLEDFRDVALELVEPFRTRFVQRLDRYAATL